MAEYLEAENALQIFSSLLLQLQLHTTQSSQLSLGKTREFELGDCI